MVRQHGENLESVHPVVCGEESVQEEELADDVGGVQDLDEEVQRRDVRARPLVAEEAAEPRHLLLGAHDDVPAVVLVRVQPAVHVHSYVFDGFPSVVRRPHLSLLRHVHNLLHVNPGPAIKQPPDDVRELEHERLEEENEGDPLVVGDLFCISLAMVHRDRRVHGDVVRVFNPAVGLGVVDVGPSELRRTPAVDGVAYELRRRHDDGEQGQHEHRPHMVDAVDPVVVTGALQLLQRGNPANDVTDSPGKDNEYVLVTRKWKRQ